jgi:2-dehydro-3-deoxyphosphogalactonate aldolase
VDLRAWLARCPLVAVLRGIRPVEAVPIGAALVDAGIVIIEVPLNSPEPFASIERLQAQWGDQILIGAGTVMRPGQVRDVVAAGGSLIVTPHAAVPVVRAAKTIGAVAIPGFFTATEAFALLDAGADALKFFPAEASIPSALKALRAVLPPDTLVLPVGGVGPGTMAAWQVAGASGFGVGSSLYKPGDDASVVGARARALVTEVSRLGMGVEEAGAAEDGMR